MRMDPVADLRACGYRCARIVFGSILANFFGSVQNNKVWIGILTVLFLTTMNLLGTKFGGFIQIMFIVGKLIPIFMIAFFGL